MSDVQQGARRPDRIRSRRRIARTAAPFAALAVAVSLAACSPSVAPEEPTPSQTTDTPTTAPTPTPTPTEDPTPTPEPTETSSDDRSELLVRPEEMDQDDEAGAIAAAKYTVALYEYSYATGDLEPWLGLTLEDCAFCNSVTSRVSEIYDAGGFHDMGRITLVGEPSTEYTDASGMWMIEFDVKTGRSATYDTEGDLVKEYPKTTNRLALGMKLRNGEWRVQGIKASDG